MLGIFLVCGLFSTYALVIRDNRPVKYIIINRTTGAESRAPENVRTDQILMAGAISGVIAVLSGLSGILILLVSERKRINNRVMIYGALLFFAIIVVLVRLKFH